jgi:hypothetical protein
MSKIQKHRKETVEILQIQLFLKLYLIQKYFGKFPQWKRNNSEKLGNEFISL